MTPSNSPIGAIPALTLTLTPALHVPSQCLADANCVAFNTYGGGCDFYMKTKQTHGSVPAKDFTAGQMVATGDYWAGTVRALVSIPGPLGDASSTACVLSC